MAEINGKYIKDLGLKTSLDESDDFIAEDTTPSTKRVKWLTMLNEIGKELILTDTDVAEIMAAVYPAAE